MNINETTLSTEQKRLEELIAKAQNTEKTSIDSINREKKMVLAKVEKKYSALIGEVKQASLTTVEACKAKINKNNELAKYQQSRLSEKTSVSMIPIHTGIEAAAALLENARAIGPDMSLIKRNDYDETALKEFKCSLNPGDNIVTGRNEKVFIKKEPLVLLKAQQTKEFDQMYFKENKDTHSKKDSLDLKRPLPKKEKKNNSCDFSPKTKMKSNYQSFQQPPIYPERDSDDVYEMTNYKIGDRVQIKIDYSRFPDHYNQPGTVIKVEGNDVTVKWDEGDNIFCYVADPSCHIK